MPLSPRDGPPGRRPLSPTALALSAAALAVPLVVWFAFPGMAGGRLGLLLWLTCLIPVALLSRYRGWPGTTVALAAGMAVLAIWHLALVVTGGSMPDWRFVLALVAVFVTVSVAVGATMAPDPRGVSHPSVLRDPVTGLPSRAHVQITLDATFSAARGGTPLSVLLFDLDRLRWVNEEHGHEAGDEVLAEVGRLLRRAMGDGEVVGRWGGGEYLAVLPGVDGDLAAARAESLRAAVREAPLRWRPVTISVGVASHAGHLSTTDSLVAAADDALRSAKQDGGDRVEVHRFAGEAEAGLAVRTLAGVPSRAAFDGAGSSLDEVGGSHASGVERLSSDARIVVIDDEAPNLRVFARSLAALGFTRVESFQDPAAALESIEREHPDLILLDLMMPEMDGFEVLDRLRPLLDEEGFLPVLILTGERDPEIRERALRLGGKDFLNKPVDLTELEVRILNLLETRSLHRAVRDSRDRLDIRVRERTRELEDAREEILKRLARAAEYRDDQTGRHQERVGILAERLAARMKTDPAFIALLRLAAPLHDLGKIAIPDDILRKPAPLTDEQYAHMREHTRLGAELLAGSTHEILEMARVVALSHHERWDGCGYPSGLSGEDIPLVGRIVSVADVFDSLTHSRPYKEAYPYDRVMTMIRADRGTAFDPRVVDAFEELHEAGMLEDLLRD